MIGIAAIFILVEYFHAHHEHRAVYGRSNTLASLGIAALYAASSSASKYFMFYVFDAVHTYRLLSIGSGWMAWVLLVILNDLTYYWFHRAEHTINWFWASHVVHHSSSKLNMLSAARLPWTGQLSGEFLFWLWLPAIGFDPVMVMIVYNFSFIYGVWLHTETIPRLWHPIEAVFNTPTHHRIHHACNLDYMDKNLGGIFIIWDRMFGTFCAEKEQPVYGLVTPPAAENPLLITTMEWRYFFSRIRSAGSVRNVVNYIIQPPGWSHDGSTKTVRQMLRESTSPC
jgi:sterol desaturase/sphingolipid hydroxylase (fatty acid hydroxylase superfamily)